MRRSPTSPSRPAFCARPRPRPAGIALVLVLLSLAFITALTLAFFLSTTTELQSSRSYADGSSAQLLADGAVNLVTAQIQNATVVPVNPDPASPANAGIAWVSQPGLLRTFDDGGNPLKSYKLYSSGDMIVNGSFDPLAAAAQEVPADWSKRPAQFTDLNAPVVKRDATGALKSLYPIVDGNALTLAAPDGGLTYDADDAAGQPNPDGQPDLYGFSVKNAPLATASGGSSAANPVPMPVRWLYQLRDGTLASLDDAGKLRTGKASVDNPVVARLAFWTDDESCKVNINTAAGDEWNNANNFGSFCDTPRATTAQEVSLALNQPAQHEFQRYPGHPATNYLSAVFPFLTETLIADLSPRVTYNNSSRGGANPATGAMTTDADRLYATVDELRFKADRNTNPIFRPTQIDRSRFFLTTQSRAPDLNLFNQPRVTIWPESANLGARTAFDNQVAFCSTVGSDSAARSYYFVRSDPRSPTADYASQPRNQTLYGYLQGLLNRNVPGFGGKTLAKYGADQDQILTEIFDYVRCVNLNDTTNSSPYTPAPSSGQNANRARPGVGHVIPIEINDTRGFGRTSTIYSPGLQFYSAQTDDLITKKLGVVFLLESFGVADGVVRYQPDLVYQVTGINGMQVDGRSFSFPPEPLRVDYNAYAGYHENGSGNVQGWNNLFWENGSPNHRELGVGAGQYGFASELLDVNNYVYSDMNFSGGTVTLKVFAKRSDGTVPTDPIQTLEFNFPPTKLYYPYLAEAKYYGKYKRGYFEKVEIDYGNGGYKPTYVRDPQQTPNMMNEGDYFRTLEPANGDMRLIAARKNVPASAYRPHAKYDVNYEQRADGLRANNGFAYAGSWGKLVPSVTYDNLVTSNNSVRGPVVPSFLNSANLTGSDGTPYPGDWDTGIGDLSDGGLINKADEGEIGMAYPEGNYPYYSYANQPAGKTLFSPNRQVPSAAVFGSLSTGVKANRPWQTLLFCPNPAAKDKHPGFGTPLGGSSGPNAQPPYQQPPDHLLLDLFTMPVVEPYAISEPFSTAGKVNLNYQIAPFTYLSRKTALESVLRSVRVSAIPTTDGLKYKGYFLYPDQNAKYRFPIDPEATLQAFDTRFTANAPFRSASQICEMFLVPQGQTSSQTATSTPGWWDNYKLTGDNLREQPYTALYGRLTTKSNTFTVHVRVQTLQKVRNDPQQDTWKEDRDQVTGEYRGSVTLERYLDPNDPRFTSLAADRINPDTQSVNPAYRFRNLNTKQFAP